MLSKFRFGLIVIGSLHVAPAIAQLDGQLVAIYNPSPSVFQFVRYDPSSEGLVVLFDLPSTTLSGTPSATLDPQTPTYFYCTGTELWSLDPMGAAPPVVTILPLSNGATFSSIEFDACDGSLIGVINNYPASMTISRYDLSAQTFTTIADYPSIYLMGFETAFDPTLRQYYLPLFPDLYVYNVDNGSIMNQISIMPPPGESFGHIVAHCQDGSIYGTSANLNEFVKYLSIIDMESGQVDHISDTAIDQGVIKPGGGGSCIDRNNERFYWSGAGGLIVGASLETGESVPTTVSHPGEFYFLECMSPCDCLPSSLPVIQEEGIEIGVTENNMLVVQNFGDHGEMNLSILDHLGRSVANSKVDRVSGSVQLPELGAGSYLWILEAEDELIGTGRFVTLR